MAFSPTGEGGLMGWPSEAPTYVTALPTGNDGQEIYYVASATNGVIWHLKYRDASASSFKWEFIGGSPLYVRKDGASTGPTTTNVIIDLDTSNLQINIPLGGDYDVFLGCDLSGVTPGGGNTWVHAQVTHALAETDGPKFRSPQNDAVCTSRRFRSTGRSAGDLLNMTAHTDFTRTAGSVARCWMAIRPVRVG